MPLSAPHHASGDALAAATAYAIAHSPPVIIQAIEVQNAGRVVAFQITFSKPVNIADVNDVGRYGVALSSSPVGISSATYNPEQNSLTLALTSPVPPGKYTVSTATAIDRSADFITDAQGRPLKTTFLGDTFLVSFQPKGSDLLNAVRTPYPALNRLDGWTREMAPPSVNTNSDLDHGTLIGKGAVLGTGLALLHFL